MTATAQAYLGGLTEVELAEVIDDRWDPPVTRGVRLVSVFADAPEHVGQVGYVTGMKD